VGGGLILAGLFSPTAFAIVISMTAVSNLRLDVDQFIAWAADRPGRYELVDGVVYAMSPETIGHADRKAAVYSALAAGIHKNRLRCHALPDGITVRIAADTAYEPDALVYCGERLSPSSVEVQEPIIVVEVLSPSTRTVDLSLKLTGYFGLGSLAHYLIVDPSRPMIVHHARTAGEVLSTRIVTEGVIHLDPPGIELRLSDIYAER
jgi:Uma2 family endonuclease